MDLPAAKRAAPRAWDPAKQDTGQWELILQEPPVPKLPFSGLQLCLHGKAVTAGRKGRLLRPRSSGPAPQVRPSATDARSRQLALSVEVIAMTSKFAGLGEGDDQSYTRPPDSGSCTGTESQHSEKPCTCATCMPHACQACVHDRTSDSPIKARTRSHACSHHCHPLHPPVCMTVCVHGSV